MVLPELTRQQRVVMVAVIAGNGLMFSALTGIAVALPAVQRDFDVSRSTVNWVVAAALLPVAGLVTVSGRLGDLFGRRRLFVGGVVVFGLASAVCGLAPDQNVLIIGRVAQGVGVALGTPLALANLTEMVPAGRRGWAIGIFSTGTTVVTAAVPVAMAALVQVSSWRWLFLVNAPIMAAVAVLARRYLVETRSSRGTALDLPGVLLLSAGLSLVAYVCEAAGRRGMADPRTIGMLTAGLAALVAFVLVERRVAAPLLDLRLLRTASVSASMVSLAVMQGARLGVTVYLMLYLQQVLGLAPFTAGLLLLPTALGSPLFSPLAGRLTDRGSARWLIVGGLLLAPVALAWTYLGTGHREGLLLAPALFLFGVASAFVYTPASTLTMSAVPEETRGVAAGLTVEARQIGGVIGLITLGSLLTTIEWGTRERLILGPDAHFTPPQHRALDGLLAGAVSGRHMLSTLPPQARPGVAAAANHSFVAGLQAVMAASVVLLVLAAALAVVALRPPRNPPAKRRVRAPA
jgi:EmrB/QacA subfamily drug resistance transporter